MILVLLITTLLVAWIVFALMVNALDGVQRVQRPFLVAGVVAGGVAALYLLLTLGEATKTAAAAIFGVVLLLLFLVVIADFLKQM